VQPFFDLFWDFAMVGNTASHCRIIEKIGAGHRRPYCAQEDMIHMTASSQP
jgi:hypothetical protein